MFKKIIILFKHIQELLFQLFNLKKLNSIVNIENNGIIYTGQYIDLKNTNFDNCNKKLALIVKYAENKSGKKITILDVGANIGIYSIGFAKNHKTKILSFEPYKKTFEILKTNIKQNKFSNVSIFNFGLLDKNAELMLGPPKHTSTYMYFFKYFDKYSLGSKTIFTNQNPSSLPTSKFYKGDHLNEINRLDKINIIKIDVEGSEFAVLKGLEKTIKKHMPILCIEGNSGYKNQNNDLESILKYLLKIGYKKIIEFSKIDDINSFNNSLPINIDYIEFKKSTDLLIH